MNPLRHFAVFLSRTKARLARRILIHRVLYRNPTLVCDPTAIWDYGYADIDAIELGQNVQVGPFVQIIVYKRTQHSSIEGRFAIGDNSALTMGVNIRAAGGEIVIGNNTGIGANSVLIAANHVAHRERTYMHSPWDETRTGIQIGNNVWVGASCVILPGVMIGDNALVGAGSIVTKNIPANEVWSGTPARRLMAVSLLAALAEPGTQPVDLGGVE